MNKNSKDMTLKENWDTNKKKIWYYVGLIIGLILKAFGSYVEAITPQNSPLGIFVLEVISYIIIGYALIGPLIFGRDKDLDRVKKERTQQGKDMKDMEIVNEGLRVTNYMQAQVLKECGSIKTYKYDQVKEDIEETDKKKEIKAI
jgi:hypothetical protein